MKMEHRRQLAHGLAMAATGAAPPRGARACTGITLRGGDGSVVFARTLEWGTFDMLGRVAAVPAGASLRAQAMPDGAPGHAWTARHDTVAITALNKPIAVDGLNAAGLSVGMFYHPGVAAYPAYAPAQAAVSMAMTDLPGFLVTQCATVADARAALQGIRIAPVVEPALGMPAPAHLIVTEASGQAIVIESVEGALRVHDAPLGVITNAPAYDWHMTNLRNYVNLSATGMPARRIAELDFAPIGAGSGMLGLPGDFTPPSRFVRAVAFSRTARPTTGGIDTLREAFRILDNFNVPIGAAEGDSGAEGQPQVLLSATQWTAASDLATRTLYYHTQIERGVRRVALGEIDFRALGGRVVTRPLDEGREMALRDAAPRP